MNELKLQLIKNAIEDKKGEDVEVFDVHETSPFFDYIVVCTAQNNRQGLAIADGIEENLAKSGETIRNVEGKGKDSEWVLIDCDDILVHVFSKFERIRINLEELLKESGAKR